MQKRNLPFFDFVNGKGARKEPGCFEEIQVGDLIKVSSQLISDSPDHQYTTADAGSRLIFGRGVAGALSRPRASHDRVIRP